MMAGPGRAAEVALVSLIDAGAVRVSREGAASPVHGPARTWSPLQARVLRILPMSLGDAVQATAAGPEAQAMREDLVARGYLISPRRRATMRDLRLLPLLAGVPVVVLGIALELPFALTAPLLVAAVIGWVVIVRAGRPLTNAGLIEARRLRQAAADAETRLASIPGKPKSAPAWMATPGLTPADRLALVACHGLLGRIGRKQVWEVLGMERAASKTLRRKRPSGNTGGSSSCGGGCGSCSNSSCGGGGDSGSSSGSSCGGGGCGGGGGGD